MLKAIEMTVDVRLEYKLQHRFTQVMNRMDDLFEKKLNKIKLDLSRVLNYLPRNIEPFGEMRMDTRKVLRHKRSNSDVDKLLRDISLLRSIYGSDRK